MALRHGSRVITNTPARDPLIAIGPPGADGATWHTGDGSPDDALGVKGDLYLRADTGDVYRKPTDGAWVGGPVANLAGPTGSEGPAGPDGPAGPASTVPGPAGATGPAGSTGPTGATGPRGSKWFSGFAAPVTPDAIPGAVIGDFYVLNTGGMYELTASGWAIRGNIRGPAGATGATGPDGPAGPEGPEGPAGAGVESIADLPQNGATDGQAIVWSDTAGEWQPADVAAAGATVVQRTVAARRDGSLTHSSPMVVVWDTVMIDAHSLLSTGDGKFTPDVAGAYRVSASLMCTDAGQNFDLGVYKNGSLYHKVQGHPSGVANQNITCLVPMNGAGDYLNVQVAGGTRSYYTGTWNHFAAELVGPT